MDPTSFANLAIKWLSHPPGVIAGLVTAFSLVAVRYVTSDSLAQGIIEQLRQNKARTDSVNRGVNHGDETGIDAA